MTPIPLPQFADRLNEILPVMMKGLLRRQGQEMFKGKITLPQFLIMEFLDKSGKSKMKDLALFMEVTTAAMTGIVDRLVRDGYAERIYDPEDRRIIKVNLTAKGAGLAKKIHQARREMILSTFGKISENDRENYLRILTQVRDILIQEKEA